VSIDKGAQHNEEGGSAALFQILRSHIGAAMTVRALFARSVIAAFQRNAFDCF